MKASTTELREAFKIIDNVPASPVMDCSLFVRLRLSGDKLSLAMTGSLRAEASVSAQNAGGKWMAYIDRRALKSFLATANDNDTDISVRDGKIILRSGQRLEQAAHAPISGYETWEPKATFDLTDDQALTLKTAVKYLPNIAGTENVEAVLFSPDLIFVTDTLIMMSVTGSVVSKKYYMPPDVARFLAGMSAKISVDANGVGAALSSGFVFQSRSAHLDNYPMDKCKTWVEQGEKSPALTRFKASEFLEGLRISSQFLLDKSEAVKLENKDNNKLLMTVDSRTGNFQRVVLVTTANKMTLPVNLPARRVIPWLEFALSIDKECELTYAKLPTASVFRFKDDVRNHMLLVADM